MQTSLIRIGNSKGIRLTKDMLIASGITESVNVRVKKGEIKIMPAKESKAIDDFSIASEESFAADWLRPEEEEAWKTYQSDK